jgi:DNA-binding XRE family transcriptional regulator
MSLEKSVYNLGKVYGLAERAIPEPLRSPEKKKLLSESPMTYLAEIIKLLIENQKLSPTLDEDIRELLDDVDDDTPAHLPIDVQGRWWLGYNAARPTNYDKGITAARKRNKLTQMQLAEAIGTNQRVVSRWENGLSKPSAEFLSKMAGVLHCKIDDLI